MLHGILRSSCEPNDTVLVSASIAEVYTRSFAKAGVKVVRGNDDLEELVELVEALAPRLVALSLTPDERRNSAALRQLLSITGERRVPVVIDGSDDFVITSHQHRNALLDFFAREGQPAHALVLIGLVANRVYPHLQPAFLLGVTAEFRAALEAFTEATYSRNNTFAEHYYEHLFEELLSFQLRRPAAGEAPAAGLRETIGLSQKIEAVRRWPAYESLPPYCGGKPLIRMDYGENELPMPRRLSKGIILGFTNLGEEVSAKRTCDAVAGFCQSQMGWPIDADGILLGAGVFPLLYDLTLALAGRVGKALRVALPKGHYGFLPPIFTLAGCEVVEVPTEASQDHIFDCDALDTLQKNTPIDLLVLTNPTNPSGFVYPNERLELIARWASENGATLFCDEIFSLLTLEDDPRKCAPSVFDVVDGLEDGLVVFSGLSKAFAAGGLRVGWAASGDIDLLDRARKLRTVPLARHALVACEALLRGFRGGPSGDGAREVLEYLDAMRRLLFERRSRLVATLARHGVNVGGEGQVAAGLFIFPDMSPLVGRHLVTGNDRILLEEDTLTDVMRQYAGLQVNPGRWAGVPGRARLCFSLTGDAFEVALARLEWFLGSCKRLEAT